MAVRNLSWAASNETRFHPFDDGALLLDDAGTRPPLQLLADLRITSPEPLGKYIYVGAASLTPRLVTLVIMASNDLATPGIPIATISEKLPIVRHYPYQVSSQVDGAGGWVSFGDLEELLYQGRFSKPSQSLLSPLAARKYRLPPINLVRSVGGAPMTGLVRLSGGNDIEIVRECRDVPRHAVAAFHEGYCGSDEAGTQVRDVAVFRLKAKSGDTSRNVFEVYGGPCAKRPASRNCGNPQPVEFIGPVAPDCNGNIHVELRGCLDALAVRQLVTRDDSNDPVFAEETSGVILACGLSLADACLGSSRLPDSEGNLPNEEDNICEAVSISSVSSPSDEGVIPGDFEFDEGAAEDAFTDSVSDNFSVTGEWVIRFGNFNNGNWPYSVFVAGSASRNVATFEDIDAPNGFYRRVQSRVQLNAGPTGALHNAAVVANYQGGHYYVAEIDWDGHYRGFKLFRVAKFDGEQWINLFSVAVPSLQIGHTYDLSLAVYPHEIAADAWFVARLTGVTDPGLNVEIGPLAISNYTPADGFFGIGSNRAATSYLNFEIVSVLTP